MIENTAFKPTNCKFSRICAVLLAGIWMLSNSAVQADGNGIAPDTRFTPEQVVRIVITALQTNSEANGDEGIATVFQFASPENRSSTGPLTRFTRMIKRGYPDMLNHTEARYDPMEVSDKTAVQAVWLLMPSGEEIGYAFQLGKQQDGEYADMWMTDMVIPLGPGSQGGTRI